MDVEKPFLGLHGTMRSFINAAMVFNAVPRQLHDYMCVCVGFWSAYRKDTMKVKWTKLGMVVFFLLSVVMTTCFIWQYRMPKLEMGV